MNIVVSSIDAGPGRAVSGISVSSPYQPGRWDELRPRNGVPVFVVAGLREIGGGYLGWR